MWFTILVVIGQKFDFDSWLVLLINQPCRDWPEVWLNDIVLKTALSDLENQETKRYFTHKGQNVLKNVPSWLCLDGYKIIRTFAVPDPDLEISWGGGGVGGHPDP